MAEVEQDMEFAADAAGAEGALEVTDTARPQAPWKRNVALFIGSQFILMFGAMMTQFAILWHITMVTKSATMLMLLTLANGIPMFLMSPVGGVLSDRFNRKTILCIADTIIAVVTLITCVYFFVAGSDITALAMFMLMVCVVVKGGCEAVGFTADAAVVQQITPPDELERVNGFQQASQSASMFAAPLVAAGMLAVCPIQYLLLVDVFATILCVVALQLFVKVEDLPGMGEKKAQQVSMLTDFKEGLRYAKGHKFVLHVLVLMLFFSIYVAAPGDLGPLQVVRNFGENYWYLSGIELGFSGMMMIGGLVLGAWGGLKNKMHTLLIGMVIIDVCTFILGLAPNYWVYLVGFTICGAGVPMFSASLMAMLQTSVEEEYMGRISALIVQIQSIGTPVAMLFLGPLADAVNINYIVIGAGFLLMAVIVILLRDKVLLAAGGGGGHKFDDLD